MKLKCLYYFQYMNMNTILYRYGSEIPPDVLASRLSAYVHYFTLHGALRPFGCTALLAGYDASTQRHSLHMIEPSGSTFEYYAAAAGRGRQPARTEMEKLAVNPTRVASGTGTTAGGGDDEGGQQLITVAEGVRQLAKIVYTIRDSGGSGSSKDGPFEIEMSWLCEKTGWKHVGVPKDVMDEAVEWAKREIEAEGEDDDDEEDDVDGGEGMEE
jgi:20S proteasome subunit alpha 7